MTEQLKEMGLRMADLRECMGYTSVEVAERLGISEEEYLAYEKGEKDFSFSTMYNVATIKIIINKNDYSQKHSRDETLLFCF